MRRVFWGMVVCLVSVPALQAQQQPTLGPSEPSLEGPSSAKTTDSARLLRVKKIYIERMDNQLSEKLIDDLAGSSLLKVVDKPNDADAIMRGTCFNSRRLKRVHSEVFISDRASGSSIWQDVIRVPFNPPSLSKAVDTSAAEILTHLVQSIRTASHSSLK